MQPAPGRPPSDGRIFPRGLQSGVLGAIPVCCHPGLGQCSGPPRGGPGAGDVQRRLRQGRDRDQVGEPTPAREPTAACRCGRDEADHQQGVDRMPTSQQVDSPCRRGRRGRPDGGRGAGTGRVATPGHRPGGLLRSHPRHGPRTGCDDAETGHRGGGEWSADRRGTVRARTAPTTTASTAAATVSGHSNRVLNRGSGLRPHRCPPGVRRVNRRHRRHGRLARPARCTG